MSNQDFFYRLKQIECPDSTYRPEQPLIFSKAQGSYIWDTEGRRYLDLCAGFGVLALGHNPEVYRDIWQSYLSEQPPIMHSMGDVYPSQDKVILLEKLKSLLPASLSRGALALSGGQAVELGLKTALIATKKSGVICFKDCYHGLDFGALNLTSREDFKAPFKDWLNDSLVSYCDFSSDIDLLQQQFESAIQHHNKLGNGTAVAIVEPIQGRAGIKLNSLAWFRTLRLLCDQHNVLLMYDEVFTGLGRTGSVSFAEQVPCDISCFGKALGGGLPLSACFATENVMMSWPENSGEALHTGTFFGHPLSCQLGLIFLEQLEKQNLSQRSHDLGEQFKNILREKLTGHVKEIRGQGLMISIELPHEGDGANLMNSLRDQGVIALAAGPKGESLSITPPLNMDQDTLFEVAETIHRLIT